MDASGDVDRICKMMCLVDTPSGFCFCPAIQTLNDVRQCLLDRVRLYRYLYSHHRVWRLENALKSAIRIMLKNPGAPKKKLIQIFADLQLLAETTNAAKTQPALQRLARRTDHWLLDLAQDAGQTLMSQDEKAHVQELFTGRKAWCSLWKREFEYRDFLIRAARLWLGKDPKFVQRLHNFFLNRANQKKLATFAERLRQEKNYLK